jgi:PAS domain S-box-containing protein
MKSDHHGHVVQFYNDDIELTESVISFVAPALKRGEGAILIATEFHNQAFEEALSENGIDVSFEKLMGRLVVLDAADTLSKFMVGSVPNPQKFRDLLGAEINRVQKVSTHVNAYGEMVGILWDEGNSEGTILLEQLWNDLAKESSFNLLCGYGHHQFKNSADIPYFEHICQAHTSVVTGPRKLQNYDSEHFRIIAELQQREAHLRKSQEELNDFFENSIVGLHWVGPDGTILRANKAELELLGYSKEEYVGRKITEFHAETDVINDILHRLTCGQTLRAYPSRLKCKDGSFKDVLIDSNVYWENGKFIHTRCFTRDVTDLKHIKEALFKTETLNQVILDNSEDCIKVLDLDARIRYMNKGGLKVTGINNFNKIDGVSWFDFWSGKNLEEAKRVFESASIGETAKFTGFVPSTQEKKRSWWDIVATPIRNETGKVHQILITSRDVTERVEFETQQQEMLQKLEAAKEEAVRANELKSAFLANMSHEIRTPLGAMIGFADLLKDPNITLKERISFAEILTRNGEQLSYIINDILDLSKVEAGHLSLEYGDVSPDHIAAEVVSLLGVKAKEKNLILECETDRSTPKSVVTDGVRLRQILLNIVGNAIKFTQFGSVKIRSSGCLGPNGNNSICFEVEDTGVGIPLHQRDRIFEMFVQGDGSMTRRFGGTGLGLALSRRLARELGGDITVVNSEEGNGSTFKIVIEDRPEKRNSNIAVYSQQSLSTEPVSDSLNGIKVLVVDDAPDNQQLIWRYLTKRGAVVDSAENGLVGCRKALSGNYDVILMDIQMPEMDGYTATQRLRSAGYQKPIIALTAHAMDEVRTKCLNVGCNDHLAKPINGKLLVAKVAQYGLPFLHGRLS